MGNDFTVEGLDKLLTQAKSARNRLEPTWMLNLAYYQGNQWVFWNRGRLDRPKLDPNRVTITDNRIVGIVGTRLAKKTKQKPAWQVVPVTGDDSDLQAALTGEKILDFLWRHLDMRTKLMDALAWAEITCAGFWKVTWDNAKGQKVQILADPTGKPVPHPVTGMPLRPSDMAAIPPELHPPGLQPKTIATGDVHVEVVSPFEIFPDPGAKELRHAEWLIQQSVKSVEYVKQHFGVTLEADTDFTPGPIESRLFPMYDGGMGSSTYKGVKLQEYWCRPDSRFPEGCRVVWAKGKILLQESNPYKQLPFVMFKGIPIPDRFWPTSIVEQLRGPQTELNKIRSQIVENAQRMGNPALLASRQANVNYSGAVGERVDYDDTVQNATPSYLTPPPMPQYVLQQQDRIEQSMQEISGQHEVSNAQVPPGVKAASAINLLQEADDTRLGPSIYDMEETLGFAGSMLLKLVAQYWTDERTVMIAGEDHAMDAMVFRGAALKENTHVEVQAGSQFPKSKAAKQAAIESILNLYFQYQGQQPMNKRMLGKVLKDLEAGGLEKLLGDTSVDESQINRENQQIAQGAELPINVFDNHQMHVEGHSEYQKGPTYGELGPMVAQCMERHIALHKQQIIKQMQPPAPPTPHVGETLDYKDAPPDIRRQIEQQAGLKPSHDEAVETAKPSEGAE